MPHYDRTQRTTMWIIVAVFLTASVLVALGIILGSLLLAVLGAVTVVAAGLCAAILPRFGLSVPVSLAENFPESAGRDGDSDSGGSGSGGSRPADGSERDQGRQKLPEVRSGKLPHGPDRQRAKPQWVNLAPHEHLRSIEGEEVIEVPEDEPKA